MVSNLQLELWFQLWNRNILTLRFRKHLLTVPKSEQELKDKNTHDQGT